MLIFAGKSFRDMRKSLRVFTPIYILLALAGMFAACDDTYNEKQMATRKQRAELRRLDSLAFKIGTTPTMDCLPVFIANEKGFFEKVGVDVRLRLRNSHLDLDTLLRGGWIEGAFTELVRAERIVDNGVKLRYVAATNSYWQLVSNRNMRIRKLDQLSDKMVAMTRFSATDYLTTLAVDSAKPKNAVYRIQINDVKIRLRMLYNNEIDAVWLTEPQLTAAKLYKNPVLMDSRKKDLNLGVLAVREKALADKNRSRQYAAFIKAYNAACDSINKYGIASYAHVISKYMGADEKTIKALPKITYTHAKAPREKDIEVARKAYKN